MSVFKTHAKFFRLAAALAGATLLISFFRFQKTIHSAQQYTKSASIVPSPYPVPTPQEGIAHASQSYHFRNMRNLEAQATTTTDAEEKRTFTTLCLHGNLNNAWSQFIGIVKRTPEELDNEEKGAARQLLYRFVHSGTTLNEIERQLRQLPTSIVHSWMIFAMEVVVSESPLDLSQYLVEEGRGSEFWQAGVRILTKQPDLTPEAMSQWQKELR